ncbi:hypothetical protein [Teichococcus coralli]|uniref:hypothetical protein n=1 Tax=Teichococcus coralli TaxID=2545983 RepID=UPI001925F574|nr:hypothetical protein [Pseudoroseomonas coralli]
MAGGVSVSADNRTRNGRPEHVSAYTRAVPDLVNEGIGFGRFGSAGPPPRGGGSFIFIARRRDLLEGFGRREMPLEGGGGFAGPLGKASAMLSHGRPPRGGAPSRALTSLWTDSGIISPELRLTLGGVR